MTKTCTKCGETKPESEYSMNGKGLMAQCKTCNAARVRRWREIKRKKKATRKIRELPVRFYSLTELRTVWKIRLSNKHLLTLLIAGQFPRPQPRTLDGRRVVWSESDIVKWLGERMHMARNVKWTFDRYVTLPDDTPQQNSCPVPYWISEGLPKPE